MHTREHFQNKKAGHIEFEGGTRFFVGKAQSLSSPQRKEMIDPQHPDISMVQQCTLLKVSRTSVYYRPRRVNIEDLELMRIMDEQYLKSP